jgi:asparagine synthase (glutamine-hydrolysing)
MSFDFLACAGPESAMREIEKRSASGGGLTIRVSRPGFRLWAPPTTPVLTSIDGTTAAVGLVIDKASGRRLSALWPGVNLDADFAGRHWGAYALVQVGVGGGLNLLREPSGTIPVFRVQRGPLALAASGPEPMLAAGMPRWTPDLHFLRHWLCFPFLRTARTGVEAVRELLPGTAVHGPGEPNTIWSPWAYAKQSPAPSWEEATAALRDALLHCVPALVPDQGKIVLQLSGGLDSSIVAAALAQAGHSFTAVTFATRAADGDERAYARDVASRLGVD